MNNRRDQTIPVPLETAVMHGVRKGTGLHERIARPIVAEIIVRLRAELYDMDLSIEPPTKDRDQEIRAAVIAGHSLAKICKRFGVSRATVYRALNARGGPS